MKAIRQVKQLRKRPFWLVLDRSGSYVKDKRGGPRRFYSLRAAEEERKRMHAPKWFECPPFGRVESPCLMPCAPPWYS